MIRDITIGQYYPADSVLHKMDPRAKLVGTLVFIISVFVFHTFPGYAVATIFLAAMIILSKVPVKFMFKGLKAIVMLLMITVFVIRYRKASSLFPATIFRPSPINDIPNRNNATPLSNDNIIEKIPIIFSFVVCLISHLISENRRIM